MSYVKNDTGEILFSGAGVPGWGSSPKSPNPFEDTASPWAVLWQLGASYPTKLLL